MAQSLERAVYDFEVAPNLSVLGFKINGQAPQHVVIDQPLEAAAIESIVSQLGRGRELAGYNNSGFDTYLLQAVINGATPAHLHEVAQAIIGARRPAWQVAKERGWWRSRFDELDLLNYTPRGRLKQYEGRLGLRIADLPFDPHKPLEPSQMPVVLQYLDHDLLATERLREVVEPEVQSRRLLEDMFGMQGLTKKSASNVAASIILARYLNDNPEADGDALRREAARAQNCHFDFYVPDWVRQGIGGTVAEGIADAIDGTRFHIVDGVRQAPDRAWPTLIELEPGGLQVNFGLGGLHSVQMPCHYSGVSFDVESLYPMIIQHEGCTPEHLHEAEFHRIYGQLIERRLQAKRDGDKRTSNALKLVLNSCFGAFNFPYSPLYSPNAFLNITISGQLCLLALADRLNRVSEVRQ